MTLNITLFLQVANFLATYAFLHHLFFKPILQRLKEKVLAKQKAQRKLAQEHESLYKKQQDKRADIEDFQTKVQRYYVVSKPQAPVAELDISYNRNEEEIEGLVVEAKKLIVDRVPHVD